MAGGIKNSYSGIGIYAELAVPHRVRQRQPVYRIDKGYGEHLEASRASSRPAPGSNLKIRTPVELPGSLRISKTYFN